MARDWRDELIEKHQARIVDLEAALAERDRKIAALERSLAERDPRIAGLEAQLGAVRSHQSLACCCAVEGPRPHTCILAKVKAEKRAGRTGREQAELFECNQQA